MPQIWLCCHQPLGNRNENDAIAYCSMSLLVLDVEQLTSVDQLRLLAHLLASPARPSISERAHQVNIDVIIRRQVNASRIQHIQVITEIPSTNQIRISKNGLDRRLLARDVRLVRHFRRADAVDGRESQKILSFFGENMPSELRFSKLFRQHPLRRQYKIFI